MYIEDTSKPFVTVTEHFLLEEEYVKANRYTGKYLKKRKGVPLIEIFLLGLLLVVFFSMTPANFSSGILDIIQRIWPLLCMIFAFFVLCGVVPKEEEKLVKESYRTNRFMQEPQTLLFYRDYLTVESKSERRKLYRTDVENALETTDLFILQAKTGYLYIITKRCCTQNDCLLLRDCLKNTYVGKFLIVK